MAAGSGALSAHLVRRMDCLVGEVKEQALLGIVGI